MANDYSIDSGDLTTFFDTRIDGLSKKLSEYQTHQSAELHEDAEILRQLDRLPTSMITARIALGWTQTELANRTGLRAQHIHRYEKNGYSSMRLSKAIEIARLLHTALTDRRARLSVFKNNNTT
jgi:DNA-binding XRE family transcriptional regulator